MAAVENVIVQGLFCVWVIQILDGGWNEGFKGSLGFYFFGGMQVLQCRYCRYCNTSGSLTPLPCRVVNHCLVVQVLVRTKG